MKRKLKSFVAAGAILALVMGSAPSVTTAQAADRGPRKDISVLSITFTGSPVADDEANVAALEEFTNYNIKLEWLLNSSYEDQLNTRMASGTLPTIVAITGKTPSVISNARAGAFWDITDEYMKYPNLAEANPAIMNNISIDGRIYGIYRARAYGRNAISYRMDWAAELGFDSIDTLDDLYDFMTAAKKNDMSGNGKNDTYGVTLSKWDGPMDQFAVAFGAPNKWGVDENDNIYPYFETAEYMESMVFIKKLYEEGLINKDFAALETSDWVTDFRANKTAIHMDVSDEAHRSQQALIRDYGTDGNVGLLVMPEGPNGRFVQPTAGNAGFVAISKSGAKDAAALADALEFLDLCNTETGQNLLNYGVEGVHFDRTENGEIISYELDPNPREGFNQFMMNTVDKLWPQARTFQQSESVRVQAENVQYCVDDPCLPLVSEAYASKGSQLDQIVKDARVQFVVGQLDEAGFRKAMGQWFTQGGQEICDEYSALYKAAKK